MDKDKKGVSGWSLNELEEKLAKLEAELAKDKFRFGPGIRLIHSQRQGAFRTKQDHARPRLAIVPRVDL
jgi:hypothetical protein